jgi:hypothetical protein
MALVAALTLFCRKRGSLVVNSEDHVKDVPPVLPVTLLVTDPNINRNA